MSKNTSAGKSGITKLLLALVMLTGLTLSFCACAPSTGAGETLNQSERKESIAKVKSDKKVHSLIMSMLDFDIGDEYIDGAEVMTDTNTDSYGKIKIQVKKGKEDELFNLIQGHLGDYRNIDKSLIPKYQDHQYATEVRQMSSIKTWTVSKSGKPAKSIDINIYMAKRTGYTFLYIFG